MPANKFSNVEWEDEGSDTQQQPPENDARPDSSSSAASGQPVNSSHAQEIRANELFGSEILECTVSNPVKENDGTKDAYVSYAITTNTTFQTFQKSQTSVRRRFTDFVFLYKQLGKEFPASAIPPIPDKQRMEYVRGDRFGSDFTFRRACSLQRFLGRISLHPRLRRSSTLHAFLESGDWNATMRSCSNRGINSGSVSPASPESSSGGVVDAFADALMNVMSEPNKTEKRFAEVRERADKLDEDISGVEKVVGRVSRRQHELEVDFRDLAEQMQKLIALEPGVGDPARLFVVGLQDESAAMHKLREVVDGDYLGSLRDMSAYASSLKNLLKAREQKQIDYEQLTAYLNQNTHLRDSGSGGSFGGTPGSIVGAAGEFIRSKVDETRGVNQAASKRERMRKLELKIEELTTEVERSKKTTALFDEEVVREVADFQRIRRVEFKRQLGSLADAHVNFYQNVEDIWTKFICNVENGTVTDGGGAGAGAGTRARARTQIQTNDDDRSDD